jgi:hypothetical protein
MRGMTGGRRLDALSIASIALVGTMLLHGADHERQGTDLLTTEVQIGGSFLAVLAISTLYMTLSHNRHAALWCAVVGLYIAVAVTASHILPHWSAFSNSYTNEVDADVVSWLAMLSEVIAAFVLGVLGIRELRRRRTAALA